MQDERKKLRAEKRKADGSSGITGWLKDALGGTFESALEGAFGMGNSDISFLVKDPQSRLVKIEFIGKDGKELERNSWSSSGEVQAYNFKAGLPADTKILLYLATDKSLVTVPFSLKDVELP